MYKLLPQMKTQISDFSDTSESTIQTNVPSEFLCEAVFAGDKFWGVEAAYGRVDGVVRTATGYCGGTLKKPTYRENFGIDTHQRSAIFYSNEKERKQAQESKIRRRKKLSKRIVTKTIPLNCEFFMAENRHQKYFLQMQHRL